MRFRHLCLVLMVALALIAVGLAAEAQTLGSTTFGKIVIRSNASEWDMNSPGTMVWSKGVTVTVGDMTVTCERLKAWRTKDMRDFERIEAEGNVRVNGTYTAADKTKWTVKGSSEAATFDRKVGTGVLRGAVDFHAVNATTGSVLNVQAEKLIYDQKTQKLRFERGDRPVQMEFEEPQKAAATPPAAEGKK